MTIWHALLIKIITSLDFNSQFTALCIPNVNFLHFAFWIPIVNFLTVLGFAFWVPIVNFVPYISDSNCQFWVPIVNFLTVLLFAFWIPIYHHWNFTQEQLQATMNIQCWQCCTHHHPPTTPTQINLLAQPCPYCMWTLSPSMSAKEINQ